jgi:hypothetical protein
MPYVEEAATIEESVVIEAEPIIEAAPVDEVIDVAIDPVPMEEAGESEETPVAEHAKPARKRKAAAASTGRKRTAGPKPRTAAGAKRARKKPATEETPA